MRVFLLLVLNLTYLFSNEPFNSNILVERGIDPNVLNNIISNTRQKVAYRIEIKHHLQSKNEVTDLSYYLVLDPYPSYGMDLQMQVPKEALSKFNKYNIKKTLDNLMGIQLYLQHGTLYDIDSLKLVDDNIAETVISFTFNKKALPRELRHMREMTGYVHIVDGKLDRIEVKNSKRFELRGIEVDTFLKTTFFKPVETGGYLVSKSNLLIHGTKEELPYIEELDGTVAKYWNAKRQEITFDGGVLSTSVYIDNDQYETIAVDLDRTFPLLGKEARKAGYDLPKPFGVTLINMFQDTNMHMTSFEIDGSSIDFNKVLDGDSTYRSLTYAPLIRADLWVLPFVSFSLILGGTDTTTNVTLASDSGLTVHSPLPLPDGTDYEIIKPGQTLNLDPFVTNALLYGVGATVAGGFNNYFTTIDFQYIVAYTPAAEVSVDMMIITPLIGYTFTEYNTRLFIGAQYQRLTESLTFDVDIPGSTEKLSGEIGLQSDEWAGVIGTDYTFTRNWSANLLYSQGVDRRNAILGIAYRF